MLMKSKDDILNGNTVLDLNKEEDNIYNKNNYDLHKN